MLYSPKEKSMSREIERKKSTDIKQNTHTDELINKKKYHRS